MSGGGGWVTCYEVTGFLQEKPETVSVDRISVIKGSYDLLYPMAFMFSWGQTYAPI
jgi:hypothetical protein